MPKITKGEFAKAAGISAGRVSQLLAEGLPVDGDGRIDEEAGRAWIAANIDPDRRRGGGREKGTTRAKPEEPKPDDGGVLQTVSRLRGHKLARESQLLDIELKRRNGELIDRVEVERTVFARARLERDVWLSFASRASAALAGAGIDPGRSFPVLDRLIREQLGELAATPLSLEKS